MLKSIAKYSRYFVILMLLITALLMPGCDSRSNLLQDGYYTAEYAEFDEQGWKEFLTIYVKDNKIITVEYNAKNPSGFIKSWDMEYMRLMNNEQGTYPNEYTRIYSEDLINRQSPAEIDAITGATKSYKSFQMLAEAAIEQARKGDKNIAFISDKV